MQGKDKKLFKFKYLIYSRAHRKPVHRGRGGEIYKNNKEIYQQVFLTKDLQCKDGNVQFTTVPLNLYLINNVEDIIVFIA